MSSELETEIERVQERLTHYESLRNMRVFEVEPAIKGCTDDLIFARGVADEDEALIPEALSRLARWI